MFFRSAMRSFLGSFSNFFLSIVLGAFAMGTFWYYYPDQFVQLQRSASAVREFIVAHSWSARSESIFRFLLEDRQLLLIAFVLAIRFLLGVLFLPFRALVSRE
ncbi:MAG TPA: hypothetical protein VN524_12075 [Hyphomicrobiaceae bacterium]|nr:hypothetical protein [Hyphomicrobiaceae bacterium]